MSAAGCQVLSKKTLERKAKRYKQTIRSASRKYGVSEDLIKAVISVESCFKRKTRGAAGEKGLMQLMPATARRFNVRRGYNPWGNVHGATRYLSYLFKRYRGDTRRAVAAYNAGEGNVRPGKRKGRTHKKVNVNKSRKAKKATQKQRLKNKQAQGPRSFLVKRGHTVYEVMRRTSVPVKKIIQLNRLKAPFHVQIGQRLQLR